MSIIKSYKIKCCGCGAQSIQDSDQYLGNRGTFRDGWVSFKISNHFDGKCNVYSDEEKLRITKKGYFCNECSRQILKLEMGEI